MSGFQSVVNHLRFARHWLAKAEDEFQQSHSVEGELTLSLVEAEVRKAWAESQRSFETTPVPAAPAVRRFPGRALVAGAAVMALALGGYSITRLRPAAETRIQTAGLAGHAVQALPSPAAAPAAPPVTSQPAGGGDPSAKLVATAPGRPAENLARRPGKVNRVTPLPSVRSASAHSPGEVAIEPGRLISPVLEVSAAAQQSPAPAHKAEVEPALPLAEHPAAEKPAERKPEGLQTAELAAVAVPVVEKHSPAAATASEGGGTPLPLDVVELVRIAERSLTGRP